MKDLPKANHDRGNQYTGGKGAAVHHSQPTKQEAIKNLGFESTQAKRFETLAEHPEIAEQVKAICFDMTNQNR